MRLIVATSAAGALCGMIVYHELGIPPAPLACALLGALVGGTIQLLVRPVRVPARSWRLRIVPGADQILALAVFSALAFVMVQAAEAARDAARRSPCLNTLHQHSGWHRDCVWLDAEMNFVRVSCCPTCTGVCQPLFLVLGSAKPVPPEIAAERVLPELTVVRAIHALESVKSLPEFQRRSDSLKRQLAEVLNRQHLCGGQR